MEEYIKECINQTLENYEKDYGIPEELIIELADDLAISIENYSLGQIPAEDPKEAEMSHLKDTHKHELEYSEKFYENQLKDKDDIISQLRNRIYDLKHNLGQ